MSENNQGDLKINGSGTASGGTYKNVRINGSGHIMGDVTCEDFTINGSGEVSDNVDSKFFRVNGSGRIGGKLTAGELKVNGSATFNSDVKGGDIDISGTSDFKKNINAHFIKVSGSVKAEGDLSAEVFNSNGLFEINGLLNADSVDINLYWHKSRAREIGGEKITVRVGKGGFGVLASIFSLSGHNPCLETDTIEGNDITLENTTAKVVRGTNITIGSGCDIGLVEYKGSFHKAGSAKVAEEKKV